MPRKRWYAILLMLPLRSFLLFAVGLIGLLVNIFLNPDFDGNALASLLANGLALIVGFVCLFDRSRIRSFFLSCAIAASFLLLALGPMNHDSYLNINMWWCLLVLISICISKYYDDHPQSDVRLDLRDFFRRNVW